MLLFPFLIKERTMNFNKERFKESLAKRLSSQFNQEFNSKISKHEFINTIFTNVMNI